MEALIRFVEAGLTAGLRKSDLSDALLKAGWSNDEVQEALGRYADIPFALPVPKPRTSGSAREAFLYLLTFFALYTSTIALTSLMFGLTDHYFPDPVADNYSYDGGYGGLRWAVASLIVAFPIYMLLMRNHLKSYAIDPERRKSAVRRWLTFLTLFVAAAVFVGYLIWIIGNVLDGEIAARFLFKSLVALGLAGGVFGYYFWEMKVTDKDVAK